MTEYFIAIQSFLGPLGYVLLFYVIFQLSRKDSQRNHVSSRIVLAAFGLIAPGIVFSLFRIVVRDSVSPVQYGRLWATVLFPWITLVPIFLFIPVLGLIQRILKQQITRTAPESINPSTDIEAQTQGYIIATGGCVIPFLLLLAASVTLCCMGINIDHDYRPAFDGPQPILQWHGIDMVCLVDHLAAQAGLSIILFLFAISFVAIRFGKPFRFRITLIELVVVVAIIAGLCALLLPAVNAARESGRRYPTCAFQLKHLALAMYNYQDAYGSLPPAYTVDEEGRPLQSWRVLLLPFLDEQLLYDKIRLNEPWDSEYNKQFTKSMRFYSCPEKCYGCFLVPYYDTSPPGLCDYSVIIGSETLFPGSQCRSLNSIPEEEQSSTLLVVERKTPVCWMDPTQELTSPTEIGASKHAVPNVAYADGSARPYSGSGE